MAYDRTHFLDIFGIRCASILFHLDREHPSLRRFTDIMRGVHHDEPSDPSRLVMSPGVSLLLGGGIDTIARTFLSQAQANVFLLRWYWDIWGTITPTVHFIILNHSLALDTD